MSNTSRVALTLLFAVLCAGPAAAQRPPAPQPAPAAPAAPVALAPEPVAPPMAFDDRNAQDTRQRFEQILRQYPPSVGQVLALDPTLFSSPQFMTTYPQLAAFVAQHPEIVRDPGFYLGSRYARLRGQESGDSRDTAAGAMRTFFEGLSVFSILATIAVFTAWVVRALLNYRRWRQVAQSQKETHAKVLDRLSSNEDLLAYLQSPEGKRFLEPASLPAESPAPSAPVSRILWSTQAGIVLLCLGGGLGFLSGRVTEEFREGAFVFGVLGIALGIGFVISAGVSYLLSRRLGLLDIQHTNA